MKDLTIVLEHRPGALAAMGEALGRAGVSVEGGGAFAVDIEVVYSDHAQRLILVVDDMAAGRAVSEAWLTAG